MNRSNFCPRLPFSVSVLHMFMMEIVKQFPCRPLVLEMDITLMPFFDGHPCGPRRCTVQSTTSALLGKVFSFLSHLCITMVFPPFPAFFHYGGGIPGQ